MVQPHAAGYAFVSYARRDQLRVRDEVERFRSWGHSCWMDEEIRPANNWPDEIARAISESSMVILFVTPSSTASRNVANEVNFAIDRAVPILPIHLERSELPPGLALRMGDVQAVLAHEIAPETYAGQVHAELGRALRGVVASSSPPRRERPRPDIDFGAL